MKGLTRLFLFTVMVAAIVAGLRLLNWMPLSIQHEGLRKYRTVEDVREELGIKKIILPSYFPQHLIWPPSEILAQGKPFPMVLMHFTDRETGDIVLAVRQADSRLAASLSPRIVQERVDRRDEVIMKGRKALLTAGSCPDGTPCHSVTWREGTYVFTVAEKGNVQELLRIAESMLSE